MILHNIPLSYQYTFCLSIETLERLLVRGEFCVILNACLFKHTFVLTTFFMRYERYTGSGVKGLPDYLYNAWSHQSTWKFEMLSYC